MDGGLCGDRLTTWKLGSGQLNRCPSDATAFYQHLDLLQPSTPGRIIAPVYLRLGALTDFALNSRSSSVLWRRCPHPLLSDHIDPLTPRSRHRLLYSSADPPRAHGLGNSLYRLSILLRSWYEWQEWLRERLRVLRHQPLRSRRWRIWQQ